MSFGSAPGRRRLRTSPTPAQLRPLTLGFGLPCEVQYLFLQVMAE